MADATPRLSSATDASEVRYAPLSWLAVCALVTGVVYLFALVLLGFISFRQGKPLVSVPLLVLPAIGILLAFAARRSIRTSEGARTGDNYANLGWWMCVIGGLCYGAYWFAVDWSMRSEAERQMKRWAETLISADPSNPNDPKLREAFNQTIQLERWNSEEVTNDRIFQVQYGAGMNIFRHTNLLVLAARNRESAKITRTGLAMSEDKENEQIHLVAGILSCDEGDFPIEVRFRSVVTERSRQWQVIGEPVYIRQDQYYRPIGDRTRYGWLMERLQFVAHEQTAEFAFTLGNQQARQQPLNSPFPFPPVAFGQALAIETFVKNGLAHDTPEKILLSALHRAQLAGPAAVIRPGGTDPGEDFFAREDGKPMSAEDRKTLMTVWDPPVYDPARFMPAGMRNANDPIRNSVIVVEPNRITVKVPVELKPYGGEFLTSPSAFSIGKLVMVCDDPAAIKEFNDARSAPRSLSNRVPEDLVNKRFPLRVIRLESNLPKLTPPAPKGGGM
jgi:hypothetical protein